MRETRLKLDMSLAQVAGTRLSRQAVHLIETGKSRPTMRSLKIIAEHLGVPLSALLRPREAEARQAQLEELGRAQRYEELAAEARQILAGAPPPRLGAVAHLHLGQALRHQLRADEALEHLQVAHDQFRALGDTGRAAEALDWRANVLNVKEDPEAVAEGEAALRLYRTEQPREPEVEARMLEHLGSYLVRRRAYPEAQARYEEALQVAGSLRDLGGMARIYHGLSRCLWSRGEQGRAIELMRRAMALYGVENDVRPESTRTQLPRAENDLGIMLMAVGRLDQAEELVQSALSHLEAAGTERLRSHGLLTMADLRQRQNRLDEAVALIEESLAVASRLGEGMALAAGYQQLGQLQARRGDPASASAAFRQALDLLRAARLPERVRECELAYQRALGDDPLAAGA